jgi:hypothetical protein
VLLLSGCLVANRFKIVKYVADGAYKNGEAAEYPEYPEYSVGTP